VRACVRACVRECFESYHGVYSNENGQDTRWFGPPIADRIFDGQHH